MSGYNPLRLSRWVCQWTHSGPIVFPLPVQKCDFSLTAESGPWLIYKLKELVAFPADWNRKHQLWYVALDDPVSRPSPSTVSLRFLAVGAALTRSSRLCKMCTWKNFQGGLVDINQRLEVARSHIESRSCLSADWVRLYQQTPTASCQCDVCFDKSRLSNLLVWISLQKYSNNFCGLQMNWDETHPCICDAWNFKLISHDVPFCLYFWPLEYFYQVKHVFSLKFIEQC